MTDAMPDDHWSRKAEAATTVARIDTNVVRQQLRVMQEADARERAFREVCGPDWEELMTEATEGVARSSPRSVPVRGQKVGMVWDSRSVVVACAIALLLGGLLGWDIHDVRSQPEDTKLQPVPPRRPSTTTPGSHTFDILSGADAYTYLQFADGSVVVAAGPANVGRIYAAGTRASANVERMYGPYSTATGEEK